MEDISGIKTNEEVPKKKRPHGYTQGQNGIHGWIIYDSVKYIRQWIVLFWHVKICQTPELKVTYIQLPISHPMSIIVLCLNMKIT